MSPNRKIFWNIAASYGRSLFSVVCGIFAMRWVLEALGQVDFGLFGLVSGLVFFVSFINAQFAVAISRYYAYSVGEAQIKGNEENGVMECRLWFSSAVIIHTILPILLMAIGYPIGIYALNNGWLNIPSDRIYACVWLWRFLCISTFVGMVNVPFQAMYTAKQNIAELTIYSFAQTLVRLVFVYYMVTHPKDWLVDYGFFTCLLMVVPQLLIMTRAFWAFPECRFRLAIFTNWRRITEIAAFAWWQILGGLGFVASNQGMSILINWLFGARVTGSFSLSQTVAGEAGSLSGSLEGAFSPAITTARGANDLDRMKSMVFMVCKIGTLLTLLFAIPMAIEIEEVLSIWLKTPPPCAAGMCIMMLISIVIDRISCGHRLAVFAEGKIAKFKIVTGLIRVVVLPLAILLAYCRREAVFVALAFPVVILMISFSEVVMAHSIVGLSVRKWLKDVMMPIVVVALIGVSIGIIPCVLCHQSFMRMVATTLCVVACVPSAAWFLLLNGNDRNWIKLKISVVRGKIGLDKGQY